MIQPMTIAERAFVQTLEMHKGEHFHHSCVVSVKDRKKSERRVFAVGNYSVYLLQLSKKKATVAFESNILDIDSIVGIDNGFRLTSKVDGGKTIDVETFSLIEIMFSLRKQIFDCFGDTPIIRFEGIPLERIDVIPKACGRFCETLLCVGSYLGFPTRSDIAWDIANIFPSNDIKAFNFEEFEQPITNQDFRTLFMTLKYNPYFKEISLKSKQSNLAPLVDCLSFNTAITTVHLNSLGVNANEWVSLFTALKDNPNTSVNYLDLSDNKTFDDKSAKAMGEWISTTQHGIRYINISNCNVQKRGMVAIMEGLSQNAINLSTLQTLITSNNRYDKEGSSALANLLKHPNIIATLNISGCSISLSTIFESLALGQSTQLRSLDISENKITKKDSLDPISDYLNTSTSLNQFRCNSVEGFTNDHFYRLFSAISSNFELERVAISFSDNNLGEEGAKIVMSLAAQIQKITFMDLSSNNFGGEGLAIISEGLAYAQSLESLILDHNVRRRNGADSAIDALTNLCYSECPLSHLSLQGSRGKSFGPGLTRFLFALVGNDSIKSINITGNEMGDAAGLALSKFLQSNHALKSLKWDSNETTSLGFSQFLSGLKRNRTLTYMQLPMKDITAAYQNDPEKLETTLNDIQKCLRRNQSGLMKFGEDDFGEDFGHQVEVGLQREDIERMCVAVRLTGGQPDQEQRDLILEAQEFHNLVPKFYEAKSSFQDGLTSSLENKLTSFVSELEPIVNASSDLLRDSMTEIVLDSCTALKENTRQRLIAAINLSPYVDETIYKKVLSTASKELIAKTTTEMNTIVKMASDYVYENYLNTLEDIHNEILMSQRADVTEDTDLTSEDLEADSATNADEESAKGKKKKDKTKSIKKSKKPKKEKSKKPKPSPRTKSGRKNKHKSGFEAAPVAEDSILVEPVAPPLPKYSGPPANIAGEIPEVEEKVPLVTVTKARARGPARGGRGGRRPPTRRPVRNARPAVMGAE
eukprot:TRINITY_DN6261_c0_g1_i1.p1 TRINITY_DN6261_c0_g1~~TRINITY_DN6261_c0_g1_i1.p1  ORF type:complete len:985 (-),score=209.62 TRINITY_DN6261_c0_g1_i1:42-2996(-)